jgi:hypothetical protein
MTSSKSVESMSSIRNNEPFLSVSITRGRSRSTQSALSCSPLDRRIATISALSTCIFVVLPSLKMSEPVWRAPRMGCRRIRNTLVADSSAPPGVTAGEPNELPERDQRQLERLVECPIVVSTVDPQSPGLGACSADFGLLKRRWWPRWPVCVRVLHVGYPGRWSRSEAASASFARSG